MRRIAIIGAGLSGSLVATALARTGVTGLAIDLIDASGTFGPGLAYAPRDPQHVLNVPAGRASIRPGDLEHFTEFAQTMDPRAGAGDYVQRAWFGRYIEAELADAERELQGSILERVALAAERVELAEDGSGEIVTFEDGSTRTYDEVVLALGNLPGGARIAIPLDPRAFPSPWSEGALDVSQVAPGQPFRVLVVGTALTAIDAVLSLTSGHESVQVTAVSRTGHMPFPQLAGDLRTPFDPPAWAGEEIGLDELVDRIRAHVEEAEAAGFDWRDAVDGIRKVVPRLWQSLSVEDQARFITTFDREWELRRHRLAPQVADRLRQLRYDGRLVVQGGGVRDIVIERHDLVATLAPADALPVRETFDRVIDCTGAATDVVRTTNPLVLQLLREYRITPDPHRRGFLTDEHGTLINGDGKPHRRLHTLGVLRRGQLWETTGIAEIRDQAYALAARLVQSEVAQR